MNPTLALLITCFNESFRIKASLEQLKVWLENSDLPIEVSFVNDGSADHTVNIINGFDLEHRILNLENSQGKGGAIAEGIKTVETDYVLFMDADLATSLEDIKYFYQQALDTKADLIVANRSDPSSKITNSIFRSFISRAFTMIAHLIINFKTQDTQCGFKLFKTSVAKDLFSDLKVFDYSFDLWKYFIVLRPSTNLFNDP